jgi:hypothetical protein
MGQAMECNYARTFIVSEHVVEMVIHLTHLASPIQKGSMPSAKPYGKSPRYFRLFGITLSD